MSEKEEDCAIACNSLMTFVGNEIKRNDIRLPLTKEFNKLYAKFWTEAILSMMLRGVYCSKELPNNEFVESLKNALDFHSTEEIKKIKKAMQVLYSRDLSKYAKENVVALVNRSMKNNTDIHSTVREYFIVVSDSTVAEIEKVLKGGQFT